MNNKLQHFDPNIVEELRTVHEDRPDYSFSDDEIDKLFIAIDYWRRGLQDEHLLVITLTQSMKLLLEEVKKLKFARCKNCKWFSREPIEGKWPHKGSGLSTIQGEKRLLNKGFGRCINDKVDEQAFFYDDEQVGFGQPSYPEKVDYTGMMIDCGTNECGFLFHETFGCVNFEKREAEYRRDSTQL